ncbi:MAG: hypothetical protein E6Q60_00585 [Nitrosomonas oligotropha]|uniref:Uncharacterized protein n=1 Tax=Nitrosomonas oligotropha TaxID=42354 RepID=A0A5C7W065_9PROT|nr:MAG: hypothetical protein E6Q60_00585 [Nitrosomonas oligotropha]
MPDDLIVQQGTTITLDDNPKGALEAARQVVQLKTFEDFFNHEIVSSRTALEQMINATKDATQIALTSKDTFSPMVNVRGTNRPDLRRFGNFAAASSEATAHEQSTFWRFIRAVPPERVAKLDMKASLSSAGLAHLSIIAKYLFRDLTIEQNATLLIKGKQQFISVNDILIKQRGRIVINGSGVRIKANSIQGDQFNPFLEPLGTTQRYVPHFILTGENHA